MTLMALILAALVSRTHAVRSKNNYQKGVHHSDVDDTYRAGSQEHYSTLFDEEFGVQSIDYDYSDELDVNANEPSGIAHGSKKESKNRRRRPKSGKRRLMSKYENNAERLAARE